MGKAVQLRRAMIAALAVAATAAAVHFSGRTGGESLNVDGATPATPDAAEPKSASFAELIGASRRGLPDEARGDLFGGLTPRSEPAPQKTTPAIAPKPAAPPFPYKYGGWVAVGGTLRVHYLQKGNEVIAINKGDVLDGVWRVDAVGEDRIEVSFVPGGQQLSMLLASLTGEATAVGGASALHHIPSSAAAQPAMSTEPLLIGAVGLPAAMAPAQPSPRLGVASAVTSARIQNQSAAAGPGSSSTVPTGKLGVDAPGSGSMPTGAAQAGASMPIGPAPSGSMPTNPAPTGKKLGLE